MNSSIVPTNVEGKQSDLQYAVTLPDRGAAVNCFTRACKRLRNPPVWHELCGALSASFKLIAEDGREANRLAEADDYFRINIPGPGNAAGGGYDWVRVEAIEDNTDNNKEEESFGMKLRPGSNPNDGSATDTAHFFESTATSTFIVSRKGNVVTAYYYGRNEVANTNTDKTLDNIRNAVIAAGGFMSLSEAQWHALIKGLLQEEIGG